MSSEPLAELAEFDDDAGYAWWRNTHPEGFVLAVRARRAPLLHKARCSEVDRDRHPGRLKAKGSRQICGEKKSELRAWVSREMPERTGMIDRCPKCAP